MEVTASRARAGIARFDSPAALVDTEIDGSPLADEVGPEARARITEEVTARLGDWVRPGHPFEIPFVCNVVAARKPGR